MKNFLPTLKKVLSDLIIVFLGVFMAFQLNRYQSAQASKKIELGYYKIILKEFETNLIEIKRSKNALEVYLNEFKQKRADNELPNVISMNEYRLDNNLFVIESAFESGHLENLNPDFITNISNGSNFITRVASLINQFDSKLNLALSENEWAFNKLFTDSYDLQAKYSWYQTDLEFILMYLTQLEIAFEKGAIPEIQLIIDSRE